MKTTVTIEVNIDVAKVITALTQFVVAIASIIHYL